MSDQETKADEGADGDEQKVVAFKRRKPKTLADEQRLKIEKMMKNPPKVAIIPDRPAAAPTSDRPIDALFPRVPEFIRNVWGSSAGVGSGDFDVYRGIRRREYIRQKIIATEIEREQTEIVLQKEREERDRVATERTAKRRTKREKKKLRKKRAKQKGATDKQSLGGAQQGEQDEQSSTQTESESESEVPREQPGHENLSPAKRSRSESATATAASSDPGTSREHADQPVETDSDRRQSEPQSNAPIPVFLRRSAKNALTIVCD